MVCIVSARNDVPCPHKAFRFLRLPCCESLTMEGFARFNFSMKCRTFQNQLHCIQARGVVHSQDVCLEEVVASKAD